MTIDDWYRVFQIVQALTMAGTFIVAYIVGLRRQVLDARLTTIEGELHELRDDLQVGLLLVTRVSVIEGRMDRAGREQSEWAGKTQTLIDQFHQQSERLRQTFLSQAEADRMIQDRRRDVEALWHELRALRARLDARV